MAVQEQTPLQEYTANGITKQFDLEFDCESADHLIVSIDDLEVLHTDWYLSGNAIMFHVAPANGKQVKIQRNTPFNRLADYQSYNNSFRPPAINKDFDRIWWKLQELGVADWILSNRISALKAYVDDRDDELRAYLLEEIRKQGVALDQLDEYYNYLMQRLAQIAVDKGWDASFVVDGDKTQKQINNDLLTRSLNLRSFPRLEGEEHDTPRINRMISKANELGIRYCDIDDGDYYILASTSDVSWYGWDDGIELKSGVYVRASKGANIRALPYGYQGGTIIRAKSQYDVGWFGGKIIGERNAHLAPDGSAYVQRQNSTAYALGQYIWYQSWGFLVTTAGTTTASMPAYSSLNVGDSLTDGTAVLQVVSKSLGEWGHNIVIHGCDRVFIDTESVDAWGDGLEITSTQVNSGTPSSNVFVRLKSKNNRRLGISVTSCDGLYILDGTELSDTNGTAPSAGIDLEPNGNQTVKNVFIQTLICNNNEGGGFLAYANATGSKIENINADTVISRNNGSAGFRARYANIDGIRVNRLVTQGSQSIAGLRIDGGAKNIEIVDYKSNGDYVGISLASAINPKIGSATIQNSVFSNSSFESVVGGVVGIIDDQNTNLNRGFEFFSCSDLTVGKIKTLGSNAAGLYINATHGCNIGFEVNGVKSSHAVHVRGSNNNIISGVVGNQALTAAGSYGVFLDTTSTGNKINHNIIKAQTGSKFSVGVYCAPTTSGNTVMFNEVDANAYTVAATGDSGNNTLEFNSGQFAPDVQSVTTVQLQNVNHAANTKYKVAGRQVMNITTGKLYFAMGDTPLDKWRPIGAVDGTQDITPT